MKNILIIRSGGMGDVLFITPALTTIRRNFPDAKISALIPSPWGDVLKGNKDIDRIIEIPYRSFLESTSLMSVLKSCNFDLLINLEPRKIHDYQVLARGLNISFFWSLVHKDYLPIDSNEYNSKNFVWHVWETKRHYVENYLALLKEAGLDVDFRELKIIIDKQENNFVDNLLQNYDIEKNDLLIGFHPGTASSNNTALGILFAGIKKTLKLKLPIERRRWPLRYYVELANLLNREFKCRIIITGSDYEARLAKQISGLKDFEAIDLSGKTTIKQLAALYKKCDIIIASDTGPLHLAVAVGTPVVGLYGPTEPLHSRPWIEESRSKIIRSNLKCSPCQYIKTKICLHTECMYKIKPQEVFGAVKELIKTCQSR